MYITQNIICNVIINYNHIKYFLMKKDFKIQCCLTTFLYIFFYSTLYYFILDYLLPCTCRIQVRHILPYYFLLYRIIEKLLKEPLKNIIQNFVIHTVYCYIYIMLYIENIAILFDKPVCFHFLTGSKKLHDNYANNAGNKKTNKK